MRINLRRLFEPLGVRRSCKRLKKTLVLLDVLDQSPGEQLSPFGIEMGCIAEILIAEFQIFVQVEELDMVRRSDPLQLLPMLNNGFLLDLESF